MTIRIQGNPVSSRPDEDSVVILNLRNQQYYSLDGVGRAVWDSLESGPKTIAGLVELATNHFLVSASDARVDIIRLIGELEAAELVAREA